MKKIVFVLSIICLSISANAQEKEIKVSNDILQTYVGKYELSPNAIMDITLNEEKMFAQLSTQPQVEIFASTTDEFFLKVVEAKIKFNQDDKGKVISLTLYQNGREVRAKKIQ